MMYEMTKDDLAHLGQMRNVPLILRCSPNEMWPDYGPLLRVGLATEHLHADGFREYRITDMGRQLLADLAEMEGRPDG
jgi:hypothetical protein